MDARVRRFREQARRENGGRQGVRVRHSEGFRREAVAHLMKKKREGEVPHVIRQYERRRLGLQDRLHQTQQSLVRAQDTVSQVQRSRSVKRGSSGRRLSDGGRGGLVKARHGRPRRLRRHRDGRQRAGHRSGTPAQSLCWACAAHVRAPGSWDRPLRQSIPSR